jgi:glycosyltransferase involved in cell wall biosynthesis
MFFFERWILTKIKYDYQISVSEKFTKHKNVNDHIAVIPNGVDIVAFNKVKTRKNKNPQLIWVGKDVPEKGVDFLKEAISRVRKKIPKLETELVTGGRLTGVDLIRAYKKSHVFVLSSLAEGQPITLLEAWAARLPVVVTDVGDNAKLIKNGRNGILVEPENVNQLAIAILKVIRSKTTGKRMGLEGYKTVKKHFSWLIVATNTYAIYKKVLKK